VYNVLFFDSSEKRREKDQRINNNNVSRSSFLGSLLSGIMRRRELGNNNIN